MLSDKATPLLANDRVALKDERLIYRACSMAFARSLGKNSPQDVIGKTDIDLMPNAMAREQMALDSRTMYSAQADISSINLGESERQSMIVRTPVMSSDHRVRGIDIRLLSGPVLNTPRSVVTIDYETLVNDGIQGSLIYSREAILFANENAARVLGFATAHNLNEQGHIKELFSEVELARIANQVQKASSESEAPVEASQRLTLTAQTKKGEAIRLLAKIAPVQWGTKAATLLSFVDVALPAGVATNTAAAARLATIGARAPGALVAVPTDLQKLRFSEQRYRHYAAAAADFFWELDSRLMFRVVSPQLERILGIPANHLLGRTHRQLFEQPANANGEGHFLEHLELISDHQPFRDFEFRWSVDGEVRVIRYSGIPVFGKDRIFLGYRGVGCDVTSTVRKAETTAYHANHDALTGLINRRHFEGVVGAALDKARIGADRRAHALCFMDLDNFKIVNDTCGHQAGDELLRQLAQLFDGLVRKSDLLGRLGGDEFGIFLYNCSVAQALKLANQIRHEVENFEFLWHENRFTIGISIGLVVVDDRWEQIGSLFSAADSACYIAKDEGRNRVVVYREGEGNASNRKVATQWVEEINTALETHRLQLACQKIIPLHAEPDGLRFEMLLRLMLPNGDIVNPSAFFPSAERYGLAAMMDERAIDLTLAWLTANPELQRDVRHVSLNLCSATFTSVDSARKLVKKIMDSGIPPVKFCFELTETATIANLAKASEFMHEVAAIGCRFSIDDFGSGLSSFTYLRKLPVDFLKIDGRLIKDIVDDPTDYTMVKAINEVSKSMGKRTVAEFVETPGLLSAVRDIGIDFAQGFHIGEPELIETEPA